jgi:hypothetical protein
MGPRYNESSRQPEGDRVHVVDLATGAHRVIAQGDSDTGYEAFDVEADGIYASRPNNGPATPPGLWRLDPRTGTATRLDANQVWRFISGGNAYTCVPNPTDPVLEQGGAVPDTLLRLDLRTGKIAQVYRKRGTFPDVLGFDWTHRPVIFGGTSGGLLIVTGPGTVEPIPAAGPALTFTYVQSPFEKMVRRAVVDFPAHSAAQHSAEGEDAYRPLVEQLAREPVEAVRAGGLPISADYELAASDQATLRGATWSSPALADSL